MKIFKNCSILLLFFFIYSCSDDTDFTNSTTVESTYFPPITLSDWETSTPAELNWNTDAIPELTNFLQQNDTRAFIILKNGRIVMEKYYGRNILGTADFDQNTNWYWASAGKTLTSVLMGIAQQEGLLNVEDASADYLGAGWSSLTAEQEQNIKIKHHLSMTTGLDYTMADLGCTVPACFEFLAEPGAQWYYHNGPYTITQDIIANASRVPFQQFTASRIYDKIGMNGSWRASGDNIVHWSTARDMARFGLLVANDGNWDGSTVYAGTYFDQMVEPSQDLNPSYGYLWWLNGKSSFMLPQSILSFSGSLNPNAPEEMYSAMGKNGQIIDIVPSENLVVVRLGVSNGNESISAEFSRELWRYLNEVIN